MKPYANIPAQVSSPKTKPLSQLAQGQCFSTTPDGPKHIKTTDTQGLRMCDDFFVTFPSETPVFWRYP